MARGNKDKIKSENNSKRIVYGFVTVVLITFVFGTMEFLTLTRIGQVVKTATVKTSDSIKAIEQIDGVARDVREVYALTLKHCVTQDPEVASKILETLRSRLTEANTLLEQYQSVTKDVTDLELLEAIKKARAPYAAASVSVIMADHGKLPELMKAVDQELGPAYEAMIATIDKAVENQRAHTQVSAGKTLEAIFMGKMGILSGVIISLITTIGISLFIIKGLRKTLGAIVVDFKDRSKVLHEEFKSNSQEVMRVVGNMTQTSDRLANESVQQSSAVQESVVSIQQISSLIKQNAGRSEETNSLTKKACGAAEKGAADVRRMSQEMLITKTSVADISKIIRSIDEIAFQTNILSLNASVEAVRAGSAGLGFAVVADEVRKLALKSAEAARETSEKLECAILQTNKNVEFSLKVEKTFEDIAASVKQVDLLTSEVSAASLEQARGIEQINISVKDIERMTQVNASCAEDGSGCARNLSRQINEMQSVVSNLIHLSEDSITSVAAVAKGDEKQGAEGKIPTKESSLQQGSNEANHQKFEPNLRGKIRENSNVFS